MSSTVPPEFDSRPFVRLDHGMPENPKIVGLSDAAFRLFIETICWCSRQEEDGKIPAAMMRRLGRPKAIKDLVEARVLVQDGDEYHVWNYLKYQRSAAEISAFRESRKDAGGKGNHTRWHVARRKFDPGCEHCVAEKATP